MLTIEDFLRQVQQDCEFLLTDEQLFHIRYAMAHYALAILHGEIPHEDAAELAFEELGVGGFIPRVDH